MKWWESDPIVGKAGEPTMGLATDANYGLSEPAATAIQSMGIPDDYWLQGHPDTDSLVHQAVNQYPILRGMNIREVHSPGAQPYLLEFWNKQDEGSSSEPRPKGIPKGAIGVQIFDREKVTPKDVLADVASHYMRFKDPTVKQAYQDFSDSFTPEQKAYLKQDYQWAKTHMNERRPYDRWVEQTRMPAYFRGYTFDQWPKQFTDKRFTEQQKHILNGVRQYLGVGSEE